MSVSQVLLHSEPFPAEPLQDAFLLSGVWPCSWIKHPAVLAAPYVIAYRKTFILDEPKAFRAHVAGDERYHLFLNGERIGRGSERGDANHWFFDSYDFDLPVGEHTLVARVWTIGDEAPYAQISARHGFLFAPEGEAETQLLGTGIAEWDAKVLCGYKWISPLCAWGTGDNIVLNGEEFDWGYEQGLGDGWQKAVVSHQAITAAARVQAMPVQTLTPAILPPQIDVRLQVGLVRHVAGFPLLEDGGIETFAIPVRQADHIESEMHDWQQLASGQGTLTVPAHTQRRVLLDLENYYCAYPEVTTSGGRGSTLRVHWQESLYHLLNRDIPTDLEFDGVCAQTKGNRDEIEGKYFAPAWYDTDGVGDTFLPDGGQGRNWSTLWWQCGRYVEIVVSTQDEPLTIEHFAIRETRYPLEMESSFEASDERLIDIIPIMTRALQMCSHETYMDCPFYEQLQYVGDTRLESLVTYVTSRDDRLPRKALQIFDWSRLSEGLTYSRYPSRHRQITPPFALWWVAMVHDFALWRDDMEFVKSLMPGVRAVLDAWHSYVNKDGLIEAPFGWNFCDWVPGWKEGIPPDGDRGISSVLNWQLALVARQASELESWIGESEMSQRHLRFATSVAKATTTHFWDESRGLFADDLTHQHFSEHAQCLALLSGFVDEDKKERVEQGLLEDPDLARTTIYFAFYLFETLRQMGRIDKFFTRLELWFSLGKSGLKTTFEEAHIDTTRSDCHAWGAHPLWHYYASVLGIRPTAPGFSKVLISPQIGDLEHVSGTMMHPRGEIKVELKYEVGVLAATIALPEGTTGEFGWCDQKWPLRSPCEEFVSSAK